MERYWMSPDWEERLKQSRLGSLLDMLVCTAGECVSMHSRGTTFRLSLDDGQTVYLKRDHYTQFKETFHDLFMGHLPMTKTCREWHILERVRQAGFIVPEVIACGWKRSLALPTVGGMIMLPLEGTPLDEYVLHASAEAAATAVDASKKTLGELQVAGFEWADCKPEHFIIMKDGQIGLLDLERMRFHRGAVPAAICRKELEHFQHRLHLQDER